MGLGAYVPKFQDLGMMSTSLPPAVTGTCTPVHIMSSKASIAREKSCPKISEVYVLPMSYHHIYHSLFLWLSFPESWLESTTMLTEQKLTPLTEDLKESF